MKEIPITQLARQHRDERLEKFEKDICLRMFLQAWKRGKADY